MPTSSTPHILFVAAAGPRLGFGHLVRCGVLASAMRVRPRVALRASSRTRRDARALGWHVCRPLSGALRGLSTDLLIVDDPSPAEVRNWVHRARAEGIPVVAIRDLGASGCGADLTIDGTLVTTPTDVGPELRGPAFAILDPLVAELRRQDLPRHQHRVLIALGGGAYVRRVGVTVAKGLRMLVPDAHIDLAPGFTGGAMPALPPGCRWIGRHAVRRSLATASVAVVAGGLTMFEALALGTPVVTLALNEAQCVTTRRAAALGAVLDAGLDEGRVAPAMAAALATRLLRTPADAARLAVTGRGLVDGLGTSRVVQQITTIIEQRSQERRRHAA